MVEMGQTQKDTAAALTVRPALLIDRQTYRNYAVYLRRILVGFAETAHASAVVCPGDIDVSAVVCPTVEQIEYPALRLGIFRSANRRILLERLMRFKPTVIHAFYPGQTDLAAFLSASLQVPFVVTVHGQPQRWRPLRRRLGILRAAKIIAPSKSMAGRIAAAWPSLRGRIELAAIGSYVEDECACFSRKSSPTSLIAVEPLDDVRLFEPLLGALRHLILDGCELMLVLMGTGKAERAIRRQIRLMGLSNAVTIVPPMRPLRTVLSGADVFLHLKDRGLFNVQLLEAMGVGLAVAGVADPTTELLTEGQTAMLWDAADELSIYGCLKRLLGQPDTARRLALNGQALLQQQCGVSCMIDRTLEVYLAAQESEINASNG